MNELTVDTLILATAIYFGLKSINFNIRVKHVVRATEVKELSVEKTDTVQPTCLIIEDSNHTNVTRSSFVSPTLEQPAGSKDSQVHEAGVKEE